MLGGDVLYLGTGGKVMEVLDLETLEFKKSIELRYANPYRMMAAPKGRYVMVWFQDLEAKSPVCSMTPRGSLTDLKDVPHTEGALSLDGRTLILVDSSGQFSNGATADGTPYGQYQVKCSNGKKMPLTAWDNRKKWCVGEGSAEQCQKKQIKAAKQACKAA